MLSILAAATNVHAASLNSIRSAGHDDHTRVVLDLSENTPYRMSSLETPSQFELILEQTNLATDITQHSFEGTPITRLRTDDGQDTSELRLVFYLSTQVATNIFALGPNLNRGHRIVIDFYDAPETELPINQATAKVTVRDEEVTTRQGPTIVPAETSRTRQLPIEFSGTWEQEWAVESDGGGTQKFESIVEPRIDIDLPHNIRLAAIARIRIDTEGDLGPDDERPENYSSLNGPWHNDQHSELSLREFYLDAQWADSFWRLGKQQVVWGQADGIKVMDVVNPQSFREFILDDFDDSRIPLWMVKVELPVGEDGIVELLWIPDTSYHELAEAGTPYAFTSSRLVPKAPAGIPTDILEADKPDDPWGDSDAGVRYSTFLGGWDITLNYLYHYQDFPVPYQQLRFDDAGITAVLAPEYERNHLMGGTLSNVFGNVTLRVEAVYNTDTFHLSSNLTERGVSSSDEFASVIGLDWQVGSQNTLLSAQWFQSHLLDYEREIARDQTEHNLSLLYRRTFENETWNFNALGLYSLDHEDWMLQLKLSYMFRSNVELWLGGDFFGGDNDGLYGQYSEEDRILLGLEIGF